MGILSLLISLFEIILDKDSNVYGIESLDQRFQGGTIYNNASSGLICIYNQVLLGSNDNVVEKSRFEK